MAKFYETSFEEGFYDYEGIGELTCPNGWTPKWVQGTTPGRLHRPEYDAKDRDIGQPEVRTGRYAANFFTVHATHDGCLFRKFSVGAGKLVRASVWCMNVTRDKQGGSGGHGMQIGIDPTGGEDHTAESVVYGDWWSSYMDEWEEREWIKVTTEAISQADEISVFLRAKCDFPVDINASHWDDFVLEVGEAPPPPPVEEEPGEEVSAGYPTLEQIEEVVRRVVQEELAKLQ
jgi:hypothetical protein